MKFLLFILLLVASVYAENSHDAWIRHKERFHIAFRDDEATREAEFMRRMSVIETHNHQAGASFKMADNQFGHLLPHELNTYILKRKGAPPTVSKGDARTANAYRSFPASFDWRTRRAVTPVKDQGMCGSCYAFASVAAIESNYMIARKKLYELSPQEIVDCSEPYFNQGCDGGWDTSVYEYVMDNGISSFASYPYNDGNHWIYVNGSYEVNPEHDGSVCHLPIRTPVALSGFFFGKNPTDRDLQAAVYAGPVAAYIAANEEFSFYSSGIFKSSTCILGTDGNELNHLVVIVGWGTDRKYGRYWIVRNSWGTGWGENGYIRIARTGNNLINCGLGYFYSYPVIGS